MKYIASEKFSINGLFIVLSVLVMFHLLIIFQVIPFDIVWGDRLKDISQMLTFELTSVIINLVMLAIVGIKAGTFKVRVNNMIISIILWIMSGLFILTLIGNLLSKSNFEKIVFTPITILLFLFSLRLAISKPA